ncbi:flagellar export protein FliJ [Oceanobacillus salinisoli]|uniref:flagellar export protein FliJ n=1 Tax=Oceanobacillus salinisoli TaxID=2678611 RepID=UPI0012E2BC62|nr:flagellar export protein FliJ [Oceanobacillus salinisoli]
MAETLTLTKILNVRESEKKVAQKDYTQSMNTFEAVASDFYTLLKKKENAEDSYEKYIHSNVPIDQIKQLTGYIELLNRQILEVQQQVNNARNDMEVKQTKLSDAHIEVKKFEKIIEHRRQIEDNHQKKMELAFMDEISINQFLSSKIR